MPVTKRPKPASQPPIRSLALIKELLFFYAEQVWRSIEIRYSATPAPAGA